MAERPGVLRVNDRVVFSGTTHTVVAISGAMIRLLSAAGATTVVALPFLLAAADFELVGAAPAPAPRVDPHGLLEATARAGGSGGARLGTALGRG